MQFFGMLQLSDLEKIGLSLKQVYYYKYKHNEILVENLSLVLNMLTKL